jgi:hypothetical protein
MAAAHHASPATSPLMPGAAALPPASLRELDAAIASALHRHAQAEALLAALNSAPPDSTGWGTSTRHQSRLALARRQREEAEAELRAARVRALTMRLELLRTPVSIRPGARPPAAEPQQQLLAVF